MKILVTGGAGFIGSNFIFFMLRNYPDVHITNLDKLTYAGNRKNLKVVENDPDFFSRYQFIRGDIADRDLVTDLMRQKFDAVVNFAAETHVDRSLREPGIFIQTNVVGTQVLLEAVRKSKINRFIHISTDEVYGSLAEEGKFTEESPLKPNNPYSASKASADLLCRAYFKSFKLPVIITRCSNNYGPYQFPEKIISLFITNALQDKPLPLYGNGLNIRDWIYVEDHCRAIDLILRKGRAGEIYNIGGNCEKTNLEIAQIILQKLNKPTSLINFVADRPGHDWRYALAVDKIVNELGWQPIYSFETGIQMTIDWYQANKSWWEI